MPQQRLKELLRRLCDLSVERSYDPYSEFDWADSLPGEGYWMSPDLLSVFGTRTS